MRRLVLVVCVVSVVCVSISMSAPRMSQSRTFMMGSEDSSAKIRERKDWATVRGGACNAVDDPITTGPIVPGVGECIFVGASLRTVIGMAYQADRVEGGPLWVDLDRFDIEAKATNTSTATRPQLLGMLQELLAHRFMLKIHQQKREILGYSLVVAKDGPRLQAARRSERRGLATNDEHMVGQASMFEVANALAVLLQRPVVDDTGLSGWFSISMRWADSAGPRAGTTEGIGEPALFGALQQKLGLRLLTKKATVDVAIIDSVEKPIEN